MSAREPNRGDRTYNFLNHGCAFSWAGVGLVSGFLSSICEISFEWQRRISEDYQTHREDKALRFGVELNGHTNMLINYDGLVHDDLSHLVIVFVEVRIPWGLHEKKCEENE